MSNINKSGGPEVEVEGHIQYILKRILEEVMNERKYISDSELHAFLVCLTL